MKRFIPYVKSSIIYENGTKNGNWFLAILMPSLLFGQPSKSSEICANAVPPIELNNTEASFIKDGGVSVDQRKMNAVRAYFEWMPIRQVEMDDNLRIWRSFSIGTLLDLIMLDTRQYDRSITDLYWNTHYVHQISNDAGRSMMGSRQENWFFSQLKSSAQRAATWRVVGSQTVFSRINESIAYGNVDPLDYDAWVRNFRLNASQPCLFLSPTMRVDEQH